MFSLRPIFLGFLITLFGCFFTVFAGDTTLQNPANKPIVVELFISSTCPHCQHADNFFKQLVLKNPWITLQRYVINEDKAALAAFYQKLKNEPDYHFAVPTFFFCNSKWTGFATPDTTGKMILKGLTYCEKALQKQGGLSPTDQKVLQQWGNASQFQLDAWITHHAFGLVIATALMDAVMPCSFFTLMVFLAFLWLFPKQKKLQWLLAGLLIIFLGISHYFQQAHLSAYYRYSNELYSALKWIGLALLLFMLSQVRDYWMQHKQNVKLQRRQLILSVLVALLTMLAMQLTQRNCPFNISLIFDQWLSDQTIAAIKREGYLILYQIIYLLPLTGGLLLYLHYSKRPQFKLHLTFLYWTACCILLIISLLLLINPASLSSLWLSLLIFIFAGLVGWFIKNKI